MPIVSKIYTSIVRYHDVELLSNVKLARLSVSQVPNITALAASGGARDEAVKLGILLVLIAMLSERKDEFMTMFMELEQDIQTVLVIALNPVSRQDICTIIL